MAADFGKIETCSCCGKNIKKPTTLKRHPGALFGKDCRDAIVQTRFDLGLQGLEATTARVKRDWPRSWERLLAFAV